MFAFLLTMVGLSLGVLATLVVVLLLRRGSRSAPDRLTVTGVVERVRSVGKLVALEVNAKEIATSVKGWSWLPPLLLTPARVAMIFHFEKQYAVDLSRVTPDDVESLPSRADGAPRFRVTLPEVEGTLRLLDLEPYDAQAGRVLGLLDVIQMDAPTQKTLIRAAQEQAASLYAASEPKYLREARAAAERQMASLLSLFGVEAEIVWREDAPAAAPTPAPAPSASLGPARQAVPGLAGRLSRAEHRAVASDA